MKGTTLFYIIFFFVAAYFAWFTDYLDFMYYFISTPKHIFFTFAGLIIILSVLAYLWENSD